MKQDFTQDSIFWQDILAPKIVAIPPQFAVRDLCVTEDGEIRHYGFQFLNGRKQRVYTASRDNGLSWKTFPADDQDPGTMVRCPWDNYWLMLTGKPNLFAIRSSHGPGYPAEERFALELQAKEPRPPLPLAARQRWVVPVSDVACKGTCYHAGVCISDDDGCSWKYVAVPVVPDVQRQFSCDARPHWFNNGCEPTVAELSDGSLLMALRTSGPFLAFSHSEDGGDTWSVPHPMPGFWQANTMPTLLKLRDGRLLLFWNNTAMLPTRPPEETPELNAGELDGSWEAVFTNRDALHAAISEDDGKTWRGFREIALNGIRNDSDFRESGNDPVQECDKSVHQTQAMELQNGKILLAYGQHSSSRRIAIFDPNWLYETTRYETFKYGLNNVSHHLYVKSLSGGNRGWSGHCAWNRIPGVVMAREPDTDQKSTREAAWLCRINDPRLVSTRAGIVWNFPAAASGQLEIDCRIEGEGFQLALQDHWSNPCDDFLTPRSFAVIPVTPQNIGGKGQWKTIRLQWNGDDARVTLACNGMPSRVLTMDMDEKAPAGPSYIHIQTLAEREDGLGCFFRELRFEALTM